MLLFTLRLCYNLYVFTKFEIWFLFLLLFYLLLLLLCLWDRPLTNNAYFFFKKFSILFIIWALFEIYDGVFVYCMLFMLFLLVLLRFLLVKLAKIKTFANPVNTYINNLNLDGHSNLILKVHKLWHCWKFKKEFLFF